MQNTQGPTHSPNGETEIFFFTERMGTWTNNMQLTSWLGELGSYTAWFFSDIDLHIFLYKIFWILPLNILKRKTLLNWYPDLSNLGLNTLTAILQAEALWWPWKKFSGHINTSISLQQVFNLRKGSGFCLHHLKIWSHTPTQGPQVRVDETCHLHARFLQHSINYCHKYWKTWLGFKQNRGS